MTAARANSSPAPPMTAHHHRSHQVGAGVTVTVRKAEPTSRPPSVRSVTVIRPPASPAGAPAPKDTVNGTGSCAPGATVTVAGLIRRAAAVDWSARPRRRVCGRLSLFRATSLPVTEPPGCTPWFSSVTPAATGAAPEDTRVS